MYVYIRWLDDSLLDILPVEFKKNEGKLLLEKFSSSKYEEGMEFELIDKHKVKNKYYSNPIQITKELSTYIIENSIPRGLFYLKDKDADIYVGIDNSEGDAFVEEFKSVIECRKWLQGKFLI